MSGYAGRTGVFEVMPISSTFGRVPGRRSASARDLRAQAVAEGMLQFAKAAPPKVACGQTSTEEVFRVIPSEHLLLQDELFFTSTKSGAAWPAEEDTPAHFASQDDEPESIPLSRKRKASIAEGIVGREKQIAPPSAATARGPARPSARSNGKRAHEQSCKHYSAERTEVSASR